MYSYTLNVRQYLYIYTRTGNHYKLTISHRCHIFVWFFFLSTNRNKNFVHEQRVGGGIGLYSSYGLLDFYATQFI